MTKLEEIMASILRLDPKDRCSILSSTMRFMIECGEVESSSIRTMIKTIETGS